MTLLSVHIKRELEKGVNRHIYKWINKIDLHPIIHVDSQTPTAPKRAGRKPLDKSQIPVKILFP